MYSGQLKTGFKILWTYKQDHDDHFYELYILGFENSFTTSHRFHILRMAERYPTIEESQKYDQIWHDEMIKQYNGEYWSQKVDFDNEEDYAKRQKAWDAAGEYFNSIEE